MVTVNEQELKDYERDGTLADQTASASTVDLQELADKVYRLMRNELRVERARGQSVSWRGRLSHGY
jgi:hypothetical protein